MSTWATVLVAGAVAAALRSVFVVTGRVRVPARFDAATTLVAPTITAALLAARLPGDPSASAAGADVLAFALAVPVAVRARSIAWTLAVGMPLVWLLRALW